MTKDDLQTGLRKIAVIGRDDYIQKEFIQPFCKANQPTLIFLKGQGGSGKTAVMEETLEKIKCERSRPFFPNEVIDLYHTEYHTPVRLAEKIVSVFAEKEGLNFSGFAQAKDATLEAYRNHQYQVAEEKWEKAIESLVKTFETASRSRPILLAFDTIEVLDPIDYMEQITVPKTQDAFTLGIGGWLLTEFLPKLSGKVFVIVSGRHSEILSRYKKQLTKAGWDVKELDELPPLDAQSCREYLENVATFFGESVRKERIKRFLQKREDDEICQLTGGMPLNLALLADIVQSGGSIPSAQGWDEQPENLLVNLARRFLSLPDPIQSTLRAMSVLRRGANAEIISKMLDCTADEAQKWLDIVEQLLLVKKRPGNVAHPYFLHDEMYRLHDQFIKRSHPARERNYERVDTYYQNLINETRQKLERGENQTYATQHRNDLWIYRVEQVHYALWHNVTEGIGLYFMAASEAIEQREPYAFMLVQNESRRTLTALGESKQNREEIQRLKEYAQIDWKLRLAERKILVEGKLSDGEKALQKIEKAQVEGHPFLHSQFKLDWAILYIKQGNLEEASEALQAAEEFRAQAYRDDESQQDGWQVAARALGALIANYQGFLARKRGRYRDAIQAYQKSAALIRKSHWDGMLSGVLTNLAYAMGIASQDRTAMRTIKEAKQSAAKRGSVYDEIRAINVESALHTRRGEPQIGYELGEAARKKLKQLAVGNPTLDGYIKINLARALRYQWNQTILEQEDWKNEWQNYIPDALIWLDGYQQVKDKLGEFEREEVKHPATKIFKDLKDDEHLAEVHNEAGCLWREAAWVWRKNKQPIDEICSLVEKAESRFRLAAGVSNKQEDWKTQIETQIKKLGNDPFWPTLALVNLGWLHHYIPRTKDTTCLTGILKAGKKISEILELITEVIPDEIQWNENGEPPPCLSAPDKLPNVLLWAVLGKAEMLKAYEKLYGWHDQKGEEQQDTLREAVYHAALALQYNRLIGSDHYDLRRAEDALENRIRQSENWANELLVFFYRHARKIEEEKRIVLPDDEQYSGKRLALLKMLEERFGSADLWGV